MKHVAVSNENAYGVTRYCDYAIWDGLPKITSVQVPYNLMTQRSVDRGEWCIHITLEPPLLLPPHAHTIFSCSLSAQANRLEVLWVQSVPLRAGKKKGRSMIHSVGLKYRRDVEPMNMMVASSKKDRRRSRDRK